MRNPLRWLRRRPTPALEDPYAAALQVHYRRTLAEIRTASAVRRAERPDGETLRELRRSWS